jgi:hypothetical protein
MAAPTKLDRLSRNAADALTMTERYILKNSDLYPSEQPSAADQSGRVAHRGIALTFRYLSVT